MDNNGTRFVPRWVFVSTIGGIVTAFVILVGYVVANDQKREDDKIEIREKLECNQKETQTTLQQILVALERLKVEVEKITE